MPGAPVLDEPAVLSAPQLSLLCFFRFKVDSWGSEGWEGEPRLITFLRLSVASGLSIPRTQSFTLIVKASQGPWNDIKDKASLHG